MQYTPLSRHSGPFAVLVVVGLVVGVVAVHAAGLYIQFANTDVANYEAGVGAGMFGFVAVAAVVVALGLVAAVAWERHDDHRWLVAAAAAGAVAMALLGATEARTYTSMHSFAPQLRALSTFDAPPGWRSRWVRTEASETPGAEEVWDVTGGFEQVREEAVAAFTAWSDPASVSNRPTRVAEYAVLEARSHGYRAELSVASDRYRPGVVRVELSVG